MENNNNILNANEAEKDILELAADSFPTLVEKYGLEAVRDAFGMIYENSWYEAHEDGMEDEEADKVAEEEVKERIADYKNQTRPLEELEELISEV